MKIQFQDAVNLYNYFNELQKLEISSKLKFNLSKNMYKLIPFKTENEKDVELTKQLFLDNKKLNEEKISKKTEEELKELNKELNEFLKTFKDRKELLEKEVEVDFHRNDFDDLFETTNAPFDNFAFITKYIVG